MSKIMLNSMEVLIAVGLMYGMFKYWNKKLRLAYGIEGTNKGFAIFMFFQVITMLVIIVQGIDPQNAIYLEGLSMFGNGAYEYWSIVGVELFGFTLTYILANLFGHILFSVGYQSEQGLYDEVKEDKWHIIPIACALILAFGYILSHFVLKSFIHEWISNNAAFIPLT